MSDSKLFDVKKTLNNERVTVGANAMFHLQGSGKSISDALPKKEKKSWTLNGDWIKWGKNNKFPVEVMDDLKLSTVGKTILSKRAETHVGAGLYYYVTKVSDEGKRVKMPLCIPEIEEFLEDNMVFAVQKAIAEDLETFHRAVPYFLPHHDGKFISGYKYHKAIHTRFMDPGEDKVVPTQMGVSYNWPNPSKEKGQLKKVDLYKPKYNKKKPFCLNLSYSTPDDFLHYELATWNGVRENGWMAIDQLVPKLKKHIFENQAILKYHVKIPYTYWENKFGIENWAKMKPKERRAAEDEEILNLDKFLSSTSNSGKSFISWYDTDEEGKKLNEGIIIEPIGNKLKSEDYLPDATAAYGAILFAMGYDPTLIGAGLADKRNSGGSGSDKRESQANLQTSMPYYRYVSLTPLRLITKLNKWNEKFQDYFYGIKGARIQWAYVDSDTSHTLDQKKPKAGEEGSKPQEETVNA